MARSVPRRVGGQLPAPGHAARAAQGQRGKTRRKARSQEAKGRQEMTNIGLLEITTPSDREIAMTRVFNAPARLVFDAWTKPELIKQWLGVRAGWTMEVCDVDLKVGGAYRFVWRGPGMTMGMGGLYREIAKPQRLVTTEKFDEAWYEGEALDTMVLTERDRK